MLHTVGVLKSNVSRNGQCHSVTSPVTGHPRGWQDGDAEHRMGGGRSVPKKKIVTLPKLGLFLGRKAQEACPSILL